MPIGSPITPGAWGSAVTFAVFGALTGAIAAACALARLGEVDAIEIGRYCLGVQTTAGSSCRGVDGVLYVFPGLAFGVVFGPLMYFRRQLGGAGALAYALAAWVANAVAVSVSIAALHPVDDLLPVILPEAGLDVEAVEKQLILQALQKFGGNQTRAAHFLNMSRRAFAYRLKKHGFQNKVLHIPEQAIG
jgi:hypothetical protein